MAGLLELLCANWFDSTVLQLHHEKQFLNSVYRSGTLINVVCHVMKKFCHCRTDVLYVPPCREISKIFSGYQPCHCIKNY
jgi:hypothetical protein